MNRRNTWVLAANERISVPEIKVTGPLVRHDALDGPEDLPLSMRNIGRVVGLDDPLFSRENASLGMWRPMDYLESTGGGLFLLETYDPTRIPVVFVHGINGTARDFEAILASLDRTRYQAWLFPISERPGTRHPERVFPARHEHSAPTPGL